ncbi:MAG TPA: nuclear transport factor 2 family protein [Solirubrobacterales bacterium]|nr:nuclear transport factor 2 family protein [Solirubrobacterales bacterium]
MSDENLEVVRRLYEAVARRDTEAALALYHPDVEFDGRRHRWSELISGSQRFRGIEALRDWAREYYSAWEDLDDHLDEVIDAGGDQVISIVTTRGRGRASGVDVELAGSAGVWTIHDGQITKVVWYSSPEEAFEAARLRR